MSHYLNDGPIGEFQPHGNARRTKPPGISKKKLAIGGVGILLLGILLGSCGDDEPTGDPEPTETVTVQPDPTAPEPEPEPETTPEAVEDIDEGLQELPQDTNGVGEQVLLQVVRDVEDSTLFPNLTDGEIIQAGNVVCTRYELAEADTNVALEIVLEHIGGNGFFPGHISGYGTDDRDLGGFIGASVVSLCPDHEADMYQEADELDRMAAELEDLPA